MELKRIVINKEIIIQKLSSNKNITKEIPKKDNTDCSTNKGEEYLFCENVRIHQKKTFSITENTLTRLTKSKLTSTNN